MARNPANPTMPDLPVVAGLQILLVPGLVGYAVGDDGSVWSCRRPSRSRRSLFKPWHRMKPTKSKATGYWVVTLITDAGRRQFRVHCLVLLAFRGPVPEGEQGRHLDDNKDNNQLGNLAYGTPKQNAADRTRNGRTRGAKKGEGHHGAKLTAEIVREIRRRYGEGELCGDIAKDFGCSLTSVWRIANYQNWQHIT